MSTNSWTLDLCKVRLLALLMSSMVAAQLCSLEPNISKGTCNNWKEHAIIGKLSWFYIFLIWLAGTKFGLDYYIFLQVNRHLLPVIVIYILSGKCSKALSDLISSSWSWLSLIEPAKNKSFCRICWQILVTLQEISVHSVNACRPTVWNTTEILLFWILPLLKWGSKAGCNCDGKFIKGRERESPL